MSVPPVLVVAARRTPFADAGRELSGLGPLEPAAAVLAALHGELGGCPVDDVVLGSATGPGGDAARVAALAAGLGPAVPGVRVDRQCGSGLDAIRVGAALVAQGEDVVLAGGFDAGSAEVGGYGGAGVRRAAFAPPGYPDPEMGPAADALAAELGITRRRQDAYAARSHARAVAAAARGEFAAELVPVGGLAHDPRPRSRLDTGRLARFRPAFAPHGSVTAGNSCSVSDGAAAVALVSGRTWAARPVPALAVRTAVVVGGDPARPGAAAAPAVRKALARAGIGLDEVGAVEIVEAFAAQVLACTDALGLDPTGADDDRVSPQGGAIALGHPWGASGAAVVVRLFARMVRHRGPRYGVAACAVGGGQGVAVVVERVDA
ncbi:thiolase family protein [Kineococcus gynurae]|uniref:Probable acetyl-CoA acetyltransferase n=1 Tax=Kineococcus gynurae TaxID=452979 RepID=A0ABV5LR53_9ACTN